MHTGHHEINAEEDLWSVINDNFAIFGYGAHELTTFGQALSGFYLPAFIAVELTGEQTIVYFVAVLDKLDN